MKLYASIFLALFFVVLLILTGLGLYLYPLKGDLTRVGGYSENRYASQLAYQVFYETLSDYDKYDRYYDVVILGDSFSQNRSYGWQQWFANNTGLSVITLHVNNMQVESILQHSTFKSDPPKLLIYETVERGIHSRLYNKNYDCSLNDFEQGVDRISESIEIAPINKEVRVIEPIEKNYFDIEYEQAISFLRASYRTYVRKRPRAIRLPLITSELFSNVDSDSLLVSHEDFSKKKWPADVLDSSLCTLTHYQESIQRNGKTWFVSMIAPDKTTAYLPFIMPDENLPDTFMDRLSPPKTLHYVDLLKPLQSAVSEQRQDIYLPNDTHWGERGHKIVAESLSDYLMDEGIIIN